MALTLAPDGAAAPSPWRQPSPYHTSPSFLDFHQAWESCSFTVGKSHLIIIKSSVGLGEPSVLSFGEAVFYRKNVPLGLSLDLVVKFSLQTGASPMEAI